MDQHFIGSFDFAKHLLSDWVWFSYRNWNGGGPCKIMWYDLLQIETWEGFKKLRTEPERKLFSDGKRLSMCKIFDYLNKRLDTCQQHFKIKQVVNNSVIIQKHVERWNIC